MIAKIIEIFNQTKQFYNDVRAEIKKVNWPKKQELSAATVLVFILVIFIAIYLGITDFIFANLFTLIDR